MIIVVFYNLDDSMILGVKRLLKWYNSENVSETGELAAAALNRRAPRSAHSFQEVSLLSPPVVSIYPYIGRFWW